jgi:hypothetical protein
MYISDKSNGQVNMTDKELRIKAENYLIKNAHELELLLLEHREPSKALIAAFIAGTKAGEIGRNAELLKLLNEAEEEAENAREELEDAYKIRI